LRQLRRRRFDSGISPQAEGSVANRPPAQGDARRERIESWRRAAHAWSWISSHSFDLAWDFLRAFRRVSPRLDPKDLVRWVDCSIRLARVDPSLADEFFRKGTDVVVSISPSIRPRLLALCSRIVQIYGREALRDCLRLNMTIAAQTRDQTLSARLIEAALNLSSKSLGYCRVFLRRTAEIVQQYGDEGREDFLLRVLDLVERLPAKLAVDLFEAASPLIERAGDPPSPARESSDLLLRHVERFIAVDAVSAVRFFICGVKFARFEDAALIGKWAALCDRFASVEGATFDNFTMRAEEATDALVTLGLARGGEGKAFVGAVLDGTASIAERSLVAAIRCYEVSPVLLARLSLNAYRDWISRGLASSFEGNKLIAYFAGESRASQRSMAEASDALRLEEILPVLKGYLSMLTGKDLTVISRPWKYDLLEPDSSEVVGLPEMIVGFESAEERFRFYKVLAAQGAGQIEFGTHEVGTERLRTLGLELCKKFPHRPLASSNDQVDWRTLIAIFPQTALAQRLFLILENARVEHRLRSRYRGLGRDLDWARIFRKSSRPPDRYMMKYEPFLELLFAEALGQGAEGAPDAEKISWLGEVKAVLTTYVRKTEASVADTIRACLKLYEHLAPEEPESELRWEKERLREESPAKRKETVEAEGRDGAGEQLKLEQRERDEKPDRVRTKPLEQPWWNAPATNLRASAAVRSTAQPLDEICVPNAFYYDEWDARLGDYRPHWCRVIEREWRADDSNFVKRARVEHSGLIKQLRHRFQLLRPVRLRRIRGQVDGDEIDLEAAIERVIDRRAHRASSARIYVELQRREREIAVCFLLDMSGSTSARIAAHKCVLDAEKETLLLMSEALNALGDLYAIYGFSSNGRANVSFYRFKGFDEPYSELIANRIGGAKWLSNTRLGAAIRHATRRLSERSEATRLLILLSDAQPTDDEYGDTHYAREDTRLAVAEARASGIFPFCIAFGLEDDAQLDEVFGKSGYAIVQDVFRLPEKMPDIYRRLTT